VGVCAKRTAVETKFRGIARVDFGLQKGVLSAKCPSIASEKQRICSPKETETMPQNLVSTAVQ
jgi:hypothetical protein